MMQKQLHVSLHKKPKAYNRYQHLDTEAKSRQKLHPSRIRESQWDSRFHLDEFLKGKPKKHSLMEKLQSLDTLAKAQSKTQANKIIKQDSKLPEINRKLTNSEIVLYDKSSVKIDKFNLKKIWEENQVPSFHRQLFLQGLQLNPLVKARKYISKEIKNILTRKSFIFLTTQSIEARENCLTKLSDLAKAQKTSYSKLDEKAKKLVRDLQQLTLMTVENIINWRVPIEKLFKADKSNYYHITFDFKNENYLKKIMHDTKPIYDWLSIQQNDPFFTSLGLAPILRIRAVQLILLEECLIGESKNIKENNNK